MANQLPVNTRNGGSSVSGCCTPAADKAPQKMSVPPRRVIPVIFLPGIMGSNLRMSAERQAEIRKSNNIAWRPDDLRESVALIKASPADRQRQMDPAATEVDIYLPDAPTGDASVSARRRHTLNGINVGLNVGVDTPLLTDDAPSPGYRKTKEMRARERGWSEIYFDSYRTILETCEQHLNQITPYIAIKMCCMRLFIVLLK